MNTFLLTWNQLKWPWEEIDNEIYLLEKKGVFEGQWSCGNNKSIKNGDRIFLMKLGHGTKGIYASGFATSNVFLDYHWNNGKDKKANYILIDFDVILNPEIDKILTLDKLLSIEPDLKQLWTPQQSGITIHQPVSEELEKIWFNFNNNSTENNNKFFSTSKSETKKQVFEEGDISRLTITRYERNPYARKKCIEVYGTACSVCEFKFDKFYGEIGNGFTHVHHLTPISEKKMEYKLNPENDLRPVCPNCHSMIHKRKPAFTIKELKDIINDTVIKKSVK